MYFFFKCTRSKLYNKKQETIPVEALSVYAIVSKVCNGFFKYREYFSYKKVSNTESSYYDGRGRYNLTGITFLIKKELHTSRHLFQSCKF